VIVAPGVAAPIADWMLLVKQPEGHTVVAQAGPATAKNAATTAQAIATLIVRLIVHPP
jgi:hypothetical protein